MPPFSQNLNTFFGAETLLSLIPMASIDERIAALQKESAELGETEANIIRRKAQIHLELDMLEEERIKNSDKLTEDEEMDLRKELTVLGQLLTQPRVLFATLRLSEEEPDKEKKTLGYMRKELNGKYSISLEVHLIQEFGGPGLSIRAEIKTTLPYVQSVVRSMISEEGSEYPPCASTTFWSTNWDYGNRIVLTNPVRLN